jgi:nitrogen regulatory protein PII
MVEKAKVTLVTVIAAFELEQRLLHDLKVLGLDAYTVGKVDGRGLHGLRTAGLVDAPSLRLEILVQASLAESILDLLANSYADAPLIAYVHDVAAVPAENFG